MPFHHRAVQHDEGPKGKPEEVVPSRNVDLLSHQESSQAEKKEGQREEELEIYTSGDFSHPGVECSEKRRDVAGEGRGCARPVAG